MLMAGSLASNETAQVTIDSPPGGTARDADHRQRLPAARRKRHEHARNNFRVLDNGAGNLRTRAADGPHAEPVSTDLAAAWNGAYLWAGQPAQASALDVPFRTLTEHAALAGGAAVQAVGVFDPAKVASAPATPSPYSPSC